MQVWKHGSLVNLDGYNFLSGYTKSGHVNFLHFAYKIGWVIALFILQIIELNWYIIGASGQITNGGV